MATATGTAGGGGPWWAGSDGVTGGMVGGKLRDLAALYGVQLVTTLLPLLTVPFLARTLGPGTWGALAVAQAFGGLVGQRYKQLSLPTQRFNFLAHLTQQIIEAERTVFLKIRSRKQRKRVHVQHRS